MLFAIERARLDRDASRTGSLTVSLDEQGVQDDGEDKQRLSYRSSSSPPSSSSRLLRRQVQDVKMAEYKLGLTPGTHSSGGTVPRTL